MCNSKAVQADNAEDKAIAAKVPPFWREAKEDKRGRKGKLQVRVAQKQKKVVTQIATERTLVNTGYTRELCLPYVNRAPKSVDEITTDI